MSAGPWRVEITPTGNGRFNAMIVRPVPGESDQVARGYNRRSFASQAAAEKSAWGYIRERRMMHFRGRKGRRYVIVRVEPSYGGIARYSLKALSGGVKGSGPTGTRESEIERDADQSTETSGAMAGKLKRGLGHPMSWGEREGSARNPTPKPKPRKSQAEWLALFGIKD